jgi:hypothetical protein|tara:strand:- start:496 stop:858 length:363 start_codon:yes stop_codon:yes gene_type:complete
MTTLSKQDIDKLTRFRRILNIFRTLDSDMTIGEIITIIEIAKSMEKDGSGITVTGLSEVCDFPLSSTSRYTIKLAGKTKSAFTDSPLISNNRSPTSDRTKELRLTPRGTLVLNQLTDLME